MPNTLFSITMLKIYCRKLVLILDTREVGFINSHIFIFISLIKNSINILTFDSLLDRNINTFNEHLENSYMETNLYENYLDNYNEFYPVI